MRSASLLLGALVILGACGGDDPPGAGVGDDDDYVYSTAIETGKATFYDADGSGNCSFEASPSDLDVVAMAPTEYAGSASCGACIHVKGPRGEVTVRVVDSCPGCEPGHIDLSEQAFAKIAALEQGKVAITYQTVACEVSGSLAYRFKEGSSKWWTAIQVRNHKVPVTKLEYQRDGAFVPMKRATYNYFVAEKGVGDLPSGLTLRVTAADGQVVEDTLPGTVAEGKVVSGAAQFR